VGWAWRLLPVIPAIVEEEIRRIAFQGQPGQKVSKKSFQPVSQVQWWEPVISARTGIEDSPGKKERPYLKNN
jgi:hypothetical protein